MSSQTIAVPQTIQPLHDRVLIRRIPDKPYSGLLIIPDVAKERSWKGEVIAVGPGKRGEDGRRSVTELVPGDIVYFHGKWNDWEQSPEDVVLLQEADIICKVEETADSTTLEYR